MDRKALIDKVMSLVKSKKKVLGLAATGAIALTLGLTVGPRMGKELQLVRSVAGKHISFSGVFGTYGKALQSAQEKMEAIQTAEVENGRLRLENVHLRLKLEGLQFDCSAKDALARTNSIEYKLDQETGSATGRELASIAYNVPTHLMPTQVYTLGVSYFKGREDEKAAVIFTFLTGLDDNDTFKTPKNFLLTGIAWYRLDNFAMADRYFDRVLREPETPENLANQAHARLWKGLIAERLGKHAKSQFWLTELIDHHPNSDESAWVNSGGSRGVASED